MAVTRPCERLDASQRLLGSLNSSLLIQWHFGRNRTWCCGNELMLEGPCQ